jgi:hypothetical protein
MLTWRHSTMTGPGVSGRRVGVDLEPKSEQAFGASRKNVHRPVLQSFVAGDGRRLVESRAEAGHRPVQGCEQDLDAVVDRVLERRFQRDANGSAVVTSVTGSRNSS